MKKKITQIRDINKIEQYLIPAKAGVLTFNSKDEILVQFITPFLYLDKNIFISLENNDELLENIIFDSFAGFVIIKELKTAKTSENYNIIHASVSGLIKKIDEQKVLDEVNLLIKKKYGINTSDSEEDTAKPIIIMIDSEEIQAAEESGG